MPDPCLSFTKIFDDSPAVDILYAGLHQWRLYKRYSTPIDVTNLRPSRLFLFQILFQLLLPATALATVVLQVYGYRGPVCGVEVLTLVTMLLCWAVSCVLTSLERSAIDPINCVSC